MPENDTHLLSCYSGTTDLAEYNLNSCPAFLVDEIKGLVHEHLRRLRNNCGHPYNGIQKVREDIALKAAQIRNLVKK